MRSRARTAGLAAFYSVTVASWMAGPAGLFSGHYVVWVVGVAIGTVAALRAYWVRTGRRPWLGERSLE